MWEKGHDERTSRTLTKEFTLGNDGPVCFRNAFTASTTYCLKMRVIHQGMNTQWSNEAEFTTPEFKDLCVFGRNGLTMSMRKGITLLMKRIPELHQ